jgi:hypothetical protein
MCSSHHQLRETFRYIHHIPCDAGMNGLQRIRHASTRVSAQPRYVQFDNRHAAQLGVGWGNLIPDV